MEKGHNKSPRPDRKERVGKESKEYTLSTRLLKTSSTCLLKPCLLVS